MVRLWKKKYMRSLMTQYKYGQMIPSISWRGKQVELLLQFYISVTFVEFLDHDVVFQ